MISFRRRYYREKTDEELVNLYKKDGKSIYLGILYERYGHLVFGVALKYTKNKSIAEDLTMQIFENLLSKLVKHDIKKFKAWLYMVTKNECLMHFRKNGSQSYIQENMPIEEDENSEDQQLNEVKYELLEIEIVNLKDDQRKCIELFYLKNWSYQQICEELMLTQMQVKSAIQNGKRNLKLRLEGKNEFKKS